MTVFVALFVLLKVIGEHEGTGSESNALNPKDEWLFSVRSLSLPPFPSPAFPSPFFLRSTPEWTILCFEYVGQDFVVVFPDRDAVGYFTKGVSEVLQPTFCILSSYSEVSGWLSRK